ncbi:hypothetical protein BaRGS_00027452 [Batillaria attramentaria]|uniref:Uncharacterized protein n=1 Tax=Batillaria attramentaria TaxID=370345 RepID=A0ABD0K1E6_9CAEN
MSGHRRPKAQSRPRTHNDLKNHSIAYESQGQYASGTVHSIARPQDQHESTACKSHDQTVSSTLNRLDQKHVRSVPDPADGQWWRPGALTVSWWPYWRLRFSTTWRAAHRVWCSPLTGGRSLQDTRNWHH